MKVEIGELYMTAGISVKFKDNPNFKEFINKSIERFTNGDWGDTGQEDAQTNEISLENKGRLFAVYKYNDIKIWIITEWDRSYTTILFPDEY